MSDLRKKCKSVAFLIFIFNLFCHGALAWVAGKNFDGKFPSTVFLRSDKQFICTAVVVAPKTVLTSAHCNQHKDLDLWQFVNISNETIHFRTTVKKFIPHWSWNDKFIPMKHTRDLERAADLALVEFKEKLPFPPALISLKPLERGDEVEVGGAGERGVTNQSGKFTGSRKRVADLLLTTFSVDVEDIEGANGEIHYSMGARGDSGGPAYRFNPETQTYEVVGINRALDSGHGMTVSKKTGEITAFNSEHPRYFIQSLHKSESDIFGVAKYLKVNLPSDSFSKSFINFEKRFR